MEKYRNALTQCFSTTWESALRSEFEDMDMPFELTYETAETAFIFAWESCPTEIFDATAMFCHLYNLLEGDEVLQLLIVRYFALHISTAAFLQEDVEEKPVGAMKALSLLVQRDSDSLLNVSVTDTMLRRTTDVLVSMGRVSTYVPLLRFLSRVVNSTSPLSSRCLSGLQRILFSHPAVGREFLEPRDTRPVVMGHQISQSMLGSLLSFGIDTDTTQILPDDKLFGSHNEAIHRLHNHFEYLLRSATEVGFQVVRNLVSADRVATVHWFDRLLVANKEWLKEQSHYFVLSPPGLLVVASSALMQLIEPMYPDDAKQMPRLDIRGYFSAACLITNPDKNPTNTQTLSAELHPLASLFFAGLKSFQLCAGLLHKAEKLIPQLERQERDIPATDVQNRAMINRMQRMFLTILSLFAQKDFGNRLKGFALYLTRWLYFVVTGGVGNEKLPEKPPPEWKLVNQDLFNDIAEVLVFLLRTPHISLQPNEFLALLRFTTSFTSRHDFMTNKHHRGTYASLLRLLFHKTTPVFDDSLTEDLVSCILQCYIDLDSLGEMKLEPRHHMNCLLNQLWTRNEVRRVMKARVRGMSEDFTKFVNMVLTDANKTLDSAILSLKEVHAALEQPLTPESQQRTNEQTRSIRSNMQFANEVLQFVTTLCKEIPEAFLQGLVTDQVALMLDYFLQQLAGPSMTEIRVSDDTMRQSDFNHRALVEMLVECFVGISHSDQKSTFIQSMCADARSYNPELFRDIMRFLRAKKVVSDKLPQLESFFEEVALAMSRQKDDDELFSDPPDRFTCQITCVIMEDPVFLPGMPDVAVEGKAMYRHLLTEEFNPFNKAPLTREQLAEFNNSAAMVEKRGELRKEIQNWKEEMRKNAH